MWVVVLLAGVRLPADAAQPGDALAKIKQVASEDSASYERLLRRAAPLAREAFVDKPWGGIEAALKSAGLTPVEVASQGSYTEYRCVLLTNACPIKGSSQVDLYLHFGVSGGRSQPTYTVPPDYSVLEAHVGLAVTLLARPDEIRKGEWFGKGTVVQEALAAWPVVAAQPVFPILDAVDVSFGAIRALADEEGGHGYRLQFTLVKGRDDRQDGRRLQCAAIVSQDRVEGCKPVGRWLGQDFSGPGAARTLAEDLRAIVKEKDPSYQRLLYKATHVVRKAALGKPWPLVWQELRGQRLGPVTEHSWQYGRSHRYIVAEKAYTSEGGQSMDLFVEFRTFWQTSGTAPTQEMVSEAYAGLSAEVQTSHAQALAEAHFGERTAIHKALLHAEVRKAAQNAPFLSRVEIYYGVIFDRWRPLHSWGFFVDPELIRGNGDTSATANLHLSIPSELDPPETGGWAVLAKGLVAKDTLGKPAYHGASMSSLPDAQRKTTFSLARIGAPRWWDASDRGAEPTVAHGLGDLKTLSPKTRAVTVESRELYDGDLAVLARFAGLEVLDLVKCDGVTDNGLRHLAGLKNLRALTLSGEALSGTGFKHLHDLAALTSLKLYHSAKLTDQGIAAVAEMKQLTRLSLWWANELTDQQLAALAKRTALRELRLWGSPHITDAGLKHVSTLPNLQALTFSLAHGVTPAGIGHLCQLRKLQDLALGYMPLNDDALLPLSQIESLEYVELRGLAVSDQGIQALRSLVRLRRLLVESCPGVTTDGVHKLLGGLKGVFQLDP
jgi:hypothetical protein